MIDGEVTVQDSDGVSDFDALPAAIRHEPHRLIFFAMVGDRDCRCDLRFGLYAVNHAAARCTDIFPMKLRNCSQQEFVRNAIHDDYKLEKREHEGEINLVYDDMIFNEDLKTMPKAEWAEYTRQEIPDCSVA